MSDLRDPQGEERTARRYELLLKVATGGMATVYLGYLRGGLGFRQIVAIKRPHAHLLDDPSFRRGFLREANLASKIRHANVVSVRDVDATEQSIDLVMDYVQGVSLASLLEACSAQGKTVPVEVALRIVLDACAGLHAAHELTDERGAPLGLVHRDIAPQNILVGEDGVARVSDFGIAKCVLTGDPSTWQGTLKGRMAYMAPEYVAGLPIDRRADIFSFGVVVWELFSGERLFRGASDSATLANVLEAEVPRLAAIPEPLSGALHRVLLRALEKEPAKRYGSMQELSDALETAAQQHAIVLSPARVSATLRHFCGAELDLRAADLRSRLETRPSAVPDPSQERETRPEVGRARDQGTPTAPASFRSDLLLHSRPDQQLPLLWSRKHVIWLLVILVLALGATCTLLVIALQR